MLNSIEMTTSVPDEKLAELRDCLQTFLQRPKVTKREIQSLMGKLNWIAQCVYGGRFHMRRLIGRVVNA